MNLTTIDLNQMIHNLELNIESLALLLNSPDGNVRHDAVELIEKHWSTIVKVKIMRRTFEKLSE